MMCACQSETSDMVRGVQKNDEAESIEFNPSMDRLAFCLLCHGG